MNFESYCRIFGTTPDDVSKYLYAALSKGGDYADIFFESTIANELALMDGKVNKATTSADFGAGIRVISGEKTGYAFAEDTSPKELMKAARTAAEIASSTASKTIPPFNCTSREIINHYPILSPWENHATDEKKQYLELLNELIYQKDKRVINVIARLADMDSKIMFFNSLGDCFTDDRPMGAMYATCIMSDNGRNETFYATKSFRQGFEFISNELIEELACAAVDGCSRLFTAKRPPCGEMPVVMGSGSSGILLHEAIGHSFEADFNRKRLSIFCDKMGQKICNSDINIIDDGTVTGNRGSINFDDEGVPGQKTYMVKDGILNSYLHDRISAAHYNVSPTGNGRRQSFRYMPIPRMRATYMESGKSKEADIIASVKKGIYTDNFANGEVQIGAGDFTFYVKSGYLIENGKLTAPIKDANIIGNGPQALADIVAVADNLSIDNSTWTCGKGQYCPVSCGMPSVLVSKLNVGGINE